MQCGLHLSMSEYRSRMAPGTAQSILRRFAESIALSEWSDAMWRRMGN
jgi:hypothetical protein